MKTLYKYENPDGLGYELRVGFWILNGQPQKPILVKQEFQMTDSGFQKWGKARGLTAGDVYRILNHAPVLAELMDFPLPKEFAGLKIEEEREPESGQLELT